MGAFLSITYDTVKNNNSQEDYDLFQMRAKERIFFSWHIIG